MAKGKVTAIHFSEEELALLGLIQGHTGIRSRMEALRTVLQYYADAEGVGARRERLEAQCPRDIRLQRPAIEGRVVLIPFDGRLLVLDPDPSDGLVSGVVHADDHRSSVLQPQLDLLVAIVGKEQVDGIAG
jgi:hypothetical protein